MRRKATVSGPGVCTGFGDVEVQVPVQYNFGCFLGVRGNTIASPFAGGQTKR
jgi:hypothetical protein